MTIDEAIRHCEEVAEQNEAKAQKIGVQFLGTTKDREATECRECAADHRQLAEWLKQLKKAKHLIMDVSYTLDVLCDNVSCKVGCKRCTYYDEETGHCEVRKYIDKLRTFAKEVHV